MYIFPYRPSRLFIRLSVKVKTRDFWENGRETIDYRNYIQSGNKLLNNWFDCLYEKYKSLGPLYRPPCSRSIRQDLGLYIFPYRQSNQLLRRYECHFVRNEN